MADEEIKGFRKWVANRLKLNPAQPSIASLEPYASPETIVDFEQAYREIEVVHRSVNDGINFLKVLLSKELFKYNVLFIIIFLVKCFLARRSSTLGSICRATSNILWYSYVIIII